MPKFPFIPSNLLIPAALSSKLTPLPGHVGTAWRFWCHFHSLNVAAIAQEAERPFHLALIGTVDQAALLAARLALETSAPRDLGLEGPVDLRPYLGYYSDAQSVPAQSLRLEAEALTGDESGLAETLAKVILAHPELRLSLARHVPAFRPAVAAQLIGDASKDNARIALISALPGILPITAFLSPATALGDMVILTRNQIILLLKIAAAYGKDVDLRARTRELLPVVGSAFGWRAAARELIGLVPGGIGLVVKGSIAYAGTYTVGKAAVIYYSTGKKLTTPRLRQLYRDSLKEAGLRIRPLLQRVRPIGGSETPLDNASATRV